MLEKNRLEFPFVITFFNYCYYLCWLYIVFLYEWSWDLCWRCSLIGIESLSSYHNRLVYLYIILMFHYDMLLYIRVLNVRQSSYHTFVYSLWLKMYLWHRTKSYRPHVCFNIFHIIPTPVLINHTRQSSHTHLLFIIS